MRLKHLINNNNTQVIFISRWGRCVNNDFRYMLNERNNTVKSNGLLIYWNRWLESPRMMNSEGKSTKLLKTFEVLNNTHAYQHISVRANSTLLGWWPFAIPETACIMLKNLSFPWHFFYSCETTICHSTTMCNKNDEIVITLPHSIQTFMCDSV